MSARAALCSSAIAVAAVAACAEPTAIDLALVPDPSLQTEADLVALLEGIELVVDSPTGLYPEGTAPGPIPGGRLSNVDADPALEIVANVALADRLPVIRLERGGLAADAVDVRVRGLDQEGVRIAGGSVRGARFGDGIVDLAVPFNLQPDRLPPRVVEVAPDEDTPLPGCTLDTIVVVFSKPIDPTSFFAPGSVTIGGVEPEDKRLEASGYVAQITPPPIAAGGMTLQYRLQVSTSIIDREGRALDQVPTMPGAQPFVADFSFLCALATGHADRMACSEAVPDGVCPGDRFACVEGECALASCDGERCAEGTVCDPETFRCVYDCRTFAEAGLCPDGTVCGERTGTCGGQ